jgi:hypothetical protein
MDQLGLLLDGVNSAVPDFTLREAALALLLAFVLGQLVAWVYVRTHSGLSYSRSFTQSLVVMTMLVTMVMFVVGNSIITAFGLLGALALIRFRNVLKDTRDTVFVLLALAVGMACGTQRYSLAVFATAVVLLAMGYLDWTAFGTFGHFDGYLTLRLEPGVGSPNGDMKAVLHRHCRVVKQLASRHAGAGQPSELVFQIGLRDREGGARLVADLREIEGLSDAALALHDQLAEI